MPSILAIAVPLVGVLPSQLRPQALLSAFDRHHPEIEFRASAGSLSHSLRRYNENHRAKILDRMSVAFLSYFAGDGADAIAQMHTGTSSAASTQLKRNTAADKWSTAHMWSTHKSTSKIVDKTSGIKGVKEGSLTNLKISTSKAWKASGVKGYKESDVKGIKDANLKGIKDGTSRGLKN